MHATPGDEPLTSKLHTHCRYRHRHSRQHDGLGERVGSSSLPSCSLGRGSPAPWGAAGTPGRGWGTVGPHVPYGTPAYGHWDGGCCGALSGKVGCWDAGHPMQGTQGPEGPHAGDTGEPQEPHAGMLTCRAPHAGDTRDPGHATQGTPGTPGTPHRDAEPPGTPRRGHQGPRAPHAVQIWGHSDPGHPHAGDTGDTLPSDTPRRGHRGHSHPGHPTRGTLSPRAPHAGDAELPPAMLTPTIPPPALRPRAQGRLRLNNRPPTHLPPLRGGGPAELQGPTPGPADHPVPL